MALLKAFDFYNSTLSMSLLQTQLKSIESLLFIRDRDTSLSMSLLLVLDFCDAALVHPHFVK